MELGQDEEAWDWRQISEQEAWRTHADWMLRHHNAFKAYNKACPRKIQIRNKPIVTVLWGPPGTGKSFKARSSYPEYYVKPSGKWWDGYAGEEHIIFDDFYGSEQYCDLLRWLSENPIVVPVKGSMIELRADKFTFTSNQHPDKWYPNIPDTGALKRRITSIIHMDEIFE